MHLYAPNVLLVPMQMLVDYYLLLSAFLAKLVHFRQTWALIVAYPARIVVAELFLQPLVPQVALFVFPVQLEHSHLLLVPAVLPYVRHVQVEPTHQHLVQQAKRHAFPVRQVNTLQQWVQAVSLPALTAQLAHIPAFQVPTLALFAMPVKQALIRLYLERQAPFHAFHVHWAIILLLFLLLVFHHVFLALKGSFPILLVLLA